MYRERERGSERDTERAMGDLSQALTWPPRLTLSARLPLCIFTTSTPWSQPSGCCVLCLWYGVARGVRIHVHSYVHTFTRSRVHAYVLSKGYLCPLMNMCR